MSLRAHFFNRCWMLFGVSVACSPPQRTGIPDGVVTLRVIDTSSALSWDELEDSLDVYRVEVRSASRVDTLHDVIEPMPFRVGADSVAGLRLVRQGSDLSERRLFVLSASSGTMQSWPLPVDVWHHFSDLVISPDARYVAYVGADSNGTYPIVRELATGRVALRGPGGGGCGCDTDRNHARWLSADSVEIAVAHHESEPFGWMRLSARLSTRATHLDTLRSAPSWH